MKLKVCNMDGKAVGDVNLDAALLEGRRGGQALHDAVVAYQANQRAGTASTKTKGTVAGSNKKPWKQKGTGRARAGYRQSPIWRGGGVAFGPHPRKYTKDMPRKVAKLAFQRAFTDKAASGDVMIVDKFEISGPKTKAFVQALGKLKIEGAALIVVDTISRDIALASRNVPGIEVTTAGNIHTVNLLRRGKIVISQPALDQLTQRLVGGETKAS
ncbi:MAG TPA: 50S ribosomal protein L4 [Kiritimatiellia bacterium]|jgi:large subunit ribosomal protein L4